MDVQTDTDEEIVKQIVAGDIDAFGILMGRYEAKLQRYARKFLNRSEDITDLVQDVFIKAYTNLRDFDTTRSFSPWLYRIAHNVFVNQLRWQARAALPFFDADTLFPHPIAAETSDQAALDAELKLQLEQSLSQVSEAHREILVLYFYEEMSYLAISEVLRIPVASVGVRLSRAKSKLRQQCSHLKI